MFLLTDAPLLTADDIHPLVWLSAVAGLVFAVALVDIGIAFLIRGVRGAGGDDVD